VFYRGLDRDIFDDMEKLPGLNDNQPKGLYERVNDAALEKRAAYLESLKNATTLVEVAAAVEAYAVSDLDKADSKLVVIDFAYDKESGFSEMIGGEDLNTIVSGMVTIAQEKLMGRNEIRGLVFDSALAERIYEIQNPVSDLDEPDPPPPPIVYDRFKD
jgi:hypothetical protein